MLQVQNGPSDAWDDPQTIANGGASHFHDDSRERRSLSLSTTAGFEEAALGQLLGMGCQSDVFLFSYPVGWKDHQTSTGLH